ncbi:MAG TPA: hypothetical protein VJX29_08180 [Candidatus Acidoferrales bacterium]|nr:hypothetical protein [Candidatus Acidoferrales bacterium]
MNTQFSILRRYLPLAIATLLVATAVAGWGDRLFLGSLTAQEIESWDISINTYRTGQISSVIVPGGTSGIIVDNVSAEAQASSIYFTTQAPAPYPIPCGTGNFCAVKLTQGGLQ